VVSATRVQLPGTVFHLNYTIPLILTHSHLSCLSATLVWPTTKLLKNRDLYSWISTTVLHLNSQTTIFISNVQFSNNIHIKFPELKYKSHEIMLAQFCPWRMYIEIGSGNLFVETHNRLHSKIIFEEDMTWKNIHKKNRFRIDIEV